MRDNRAAYHELQSRGGIADLSNRVKLELRGADRVRYLNGQVTSNVAQLSPGQTQSACVTTAKGRLCAEILITAQSDSLLVDSDAALTETLRARLERYIVADDVELNELADSRLIHFLGPDPTELAALNGLTALPCSRLAITGWDLWLDAETFSRIWPQLLAERVPVDDSLWETLRVEQGVPRWGFELTEETLPPEAGLELSHIDFHKGCYIGQEVISRLKSIGHVNRHLCGFISTEQSAGAASLPSSFPSFPSLCAGMRIFSASSPQNPIGTITSATWSFALEKPVALGYLKRGAATDGLLARSSDLIEVPIQEQKLPFNP